jgi:hypothetical protein
VPEKVVVKIQTDTNLSLFEIDERHFPKQEDYDEPWLLKIICDGGKTIIK